MFDILADPTRRQILAALRDGERSVGELVAIAGIAQSGVSRHLGILQDAGFVQVRRDGQRRLYSLRPEPFQRLDAWMADYRRLWEDRLDRLGDVIDREPLARKERSA
jgi:DNA-binding transcriptional ArsR family regulator